MDGEVDKRQRDMRRIRTTLWTMVAVAGALSLIETTVALRSPAPGLWFLAAVTALFTASLSRALRLNRQGMTERAVLVSCVAILGIQVAYIAVYPAAYAAVAIASMVTVALALSFVQGRKLYAVVGATWLVAVVAIVFGVLAPPTTLLPPAAHIPILLGAGIAAVTVGMILLLQFAREMTDALARAQEGNEELQKAHGLLREQERAKSSFINTAAHELNTPLTPVLLQLRMLREGPHAVADGPQERMLAVLERNIQRMKNLIHDMLDIARLQNGRLALVWTEVDLATVLKAAVDDFSLTAEGKHVRLALNVPTPLVAHTDGRRVAQILSNLVGNAVRMTPPDGRVDVAASTRDGDVILQVSDTGVGLSPTQLGQLFQPFTRVHDDAVSGTGTGLGLFICHGLARELGGTLWAESDGPGRGARFFLRLPMAPPTTDK